MISRSILIVLLLCFSFLHSNAQKIIYSEPDKDDTRRMNFEIAGKIGGNYLIYKNIRNKNWISVLNNEMEEIDRVEQDYVPDNEPAGCCSIAGLPIHLYNKVSNNNNPLGSGKNDSGNSTCSSY